jgi:hypothetical protein
MEQERGQPGLVAERTEPRDHGLGGAVHQRRRGCQVKCVTFLHWHPVSEQNHKLIERRFPLGYGLGPFFGDML